jgi:hypothetical protein
MLRRRRPCKQRPDRLADDHFVTFEHRPLDRVLRTHRMPMPNTTKTHSAQSCSGLHSGPQGPQAQMPRPIGPSGSDSAVRFGRAARQRRERPARPPFSTSVCEHLAAGLVMASQSVALTRHAHQARRSQGPPLQAQTAQGVGRVAAGGSPPTITRGCWSRRHQDFGLHASLSMTCTCTPSGSMTCKPKFRSSRGTAPRTLSSAMIDSLLNCSMPIAKWSTPVGLPRRIDR